MKPVQLGQELGPEDLDRDAIHIAVLKAKAGEYLEPGQHIGLSKEGLALVCSDTEKSIGVVDPFLPWEVHNGDEFYILLKPYTITGLCHIWTHPDVPDLEVEQMPSGSGTRADGSNLADEIDKEKAQAELWLREFADEISITFDTLIYTLESARGDTWHHYTFNGVDTPSPCFRDPESMWTNFERYSGSEVKNPTHVPFSCAC